jgi:hypothetical protein
MWIVFSTAVLSFAVRFAGKWYEQSSGLRAPGVEPFSPCGKVEAIFTEMTPAGRGVVAALMGESAAGEGSGEGSGRSLASGADEQPAMIASGRKGVKKIRGHRFMIDLLCSRSAA